MLNQDFVILRFVAHSDDTILKGKKAIYDPDTCEVYSTTRVLALYELNSHGYRVLQFLKDKNSIICGEYVLVEKIETNLKR